MRNDHFTSIAEINEAIEQKLREFINEPFKKIAGCRGSAFEQIDKPALRPLPAERYEFASFATGRIGPNYHVEFDGFFYSVPYEYRSQDYTVRGTCSTVEVFVRGERICAHIKRLSGNRYVTLPEHLPEQHKVVSEWNDDRFISWAGKYGENTVAYIKAVLGSVEYSVQAYRACMGIFRQAKGASLEVVECASKTALTHRQLSSKYFGLALKQAVKEFEKEKPQCVIEHSNIRGAAAFSGGVWNA